MWAEWFGFQTLNDSALEDLLRGAAHFTLALKAGEPNPWLILLGTCGAGKSHLARRIWRWWEKCGRWYVKPSTGANCVMRGQWCLWSDYIDECRNGDSSRGIDLAEDHLVIIDDIGAGADARGWMADKLYHILERRMQPRSDGQPKATLLTANLSVEQLGQAYDTRIASRLIRFGMDKIIDVQTVDFALRKSV